MSVRGISAALLVGAATCAFAQQPSGPSTAAAVPQRAETVPRDDGLVRRIMEEGRHASRVQPDLEYLLDDIGPRLTGSPGMQRAVDWTQQQFRAYGLTNVHAEPWSFGKGWTRGPATMRMLAPQQRELLGVSWAWAPGTDGPAAGDVILMDARSQADFDKRFKGKLRGAWVMLGPAQPITNADAPPATHADSARVDSIARANAPHDADERQFFGQRIYLVEAEHPLGIIRDGAKQFGLFTMSGSPAAISPVPQVVIANEDYDQFQRLIRRGERVRFEANISNTFTNDDLTQYNSVAEIRGTEAPDQVVLVGAHLDSWDLATGGTDNGTGAIAVLEAARLLAAAGVHPKRTIRFVLFSGEEEGLFGSQAYAAAHKGDLDKFQAVLVLDNGTGSITGMALQGHDDLRDMWTTMFQPVDSLGPLAVRSGIKTGTDHLSFTRYGVPGFNYDQLTAGYNHTHHSQIDDYDHTVPADVAQAAVIMAVNAWQLADLPELLPRGR
ncbi:MAG TPA: M20/M25/M40 family metallo-hydrolase [Gemmatimonadaceae bacterium]|nr:M20/M25/M40 family metallo-hydrolase [Gemmatimonadaceae bacterium]